MRIVIDMLGAQSTGSRERGIGRYTRSLAHSIVRNQGHHEVILALSGRFPETIQPIRAAFHGLLPQKNIRVWHAPGPLSQADTSNAWRRQAAELTREAFLASLNPSIVLVCSLFEGLSDDAITSIATLDQTVPTAVILYDLIPYLNRSPYLDNPVVAEWYENKLAHLRRADLLLAISESSRQEGIDHLGIPASSIVNISTAADPHFQVLALEAAQQAALRHRYGLEHPYVMYTGGIDHRKNIEGLIRAYASLPVELRSKHQLAIVCAVQPHDRARLEALAEAVGLANNELVLVGYVPEEDLVTLYNLCKLFVFPSWHEGFGLPALEAMACGRAVIRANTSSLPEVIGCDEALFNPHDEASIARKLRQVLTDEAFQKRLELHGLEQAKQFSWDKSGRRALEAMEAFVARHETVGHLPCKLPRRPRLAYVSPLPPERSGISDYSAELLPELARYYDIDVVVQQDTVAPPWIKANCPIRTVEWFQAHADNFERVLYHFGNSSFHQHMFSLLESIPGTVVLHDFFLSGIVAHMECHNAASGFWSEALYAGHGYAAVQHRFLAADTVDVVWKYPCNANVLSNAQGVIVHSDNSRRLARQWYGANAGDDWALIPHLRVPDVADTKSRNQARIALGLDAEDFVVCSFGLLGQSKCNHRLLEAWISSSLAKDAQCVLIYVGQNDSGSYGASLLSTIANSGCTNRIRITGWADTQVFRQYLAAADVGVQLRTHSRGETSGTVLDCMNYGLPTIVNANGSMADLPDDGVWKLPDEFSDAQLIDALTGLWKDSNQRHTLGNCGQQIIRTQHAPRTCAEQYFSAIEQFHKKATHTLPGLVRAISALESAPSSDEQWLALSKDIDRSIEPTFTQRQLLVDISELVQCDAKIDIQRVVRSVLQEWLLHPPEGYRIEPVYAIAGIPGYRYARQFTLGFLGCSAVIELQDDPISFRAGDTFLGLDLQPAIVSEQLNFYQIMMRQGTQVKFLVYDLLLMSLPHCFPDGGKQLFEKWLHVVAQSDGVVCISKAVAAEFVTWKQEFAQKLDRPFQVDWFHLGADFIRPVLTKGSRSAEQTLLVSLGLRPSFLMVGTIERRKGHAQALAAFEQLWDQGHGINLVIVGKRGWKTDDLAQRLSDHAEAGRRLHWLEGVSDEFLEQVYAASDCLLVPTLGEGFGLPLIEAAQHQLPILARDLPVLREIAGEHAFYFSGFEPEDLASAIDAWQHLKDTGQHPKVAGLPWLTWKQSAQQLLMALGITPSSSSS